MRASSSTTADVVICGAGVAGVATAYHLAVTKGVGRVYLVDERPPLTLTSDKSTEAYRNWWPGPDDAMARLMNRSIDWLEKWAAASSNRFRLNRRGYVYATADPEQVGLWRADAAQLAGAGVGPLRRHAIGDASDAYLPAGAEGYLDAPDGADLIEDQALIRRWFPYLTPKTIAVLHTRRCGWFSGQQLGMYLLEQAREQGARFLSGRVQQVITVGGRVAGVDVTTADGTVNLSTPVFVNAAGPFLKRVGALLGVELPVFSERHLKASFPDLLGVVPRDAPLLIWDDPQHLPWSEEERAWLATTPEDAWLLEAFPAGVHLRPEGGEGSQNLLLLWAFDAAPVAETFPIAIHPLFVEVTLRGLATMIPELKRYFDQMPRPYLDGGYYTKTAENRPLIGPLPVEGAYVIGALSGFGLMAAPAAGELLAAHITGGALPEIAPAFDLRRYADPVYQQKWAAWGRSAQL